MTIQLTYLFLHVFLNFLSEFSSPSYIRKLMSKMNRVFKKPFTDLTDVIKGGPESENCKIKQIKRTIACLNWY